jgi:hypothetical protein
MKPSENPYVPKKRIYEQNSQQNYKGKQTLATDEIHNKYKQLEDMAKYNCNLKSSGCNDINNLKKSEMCYEIYDNIYRLRERMERILGKDMGHSKWLEKIGRLVNGCRRKISSLKSRRRFSRKKKSKKKRKKRSKKKSKKRSRKKRKKKSQSSYKNVMKRIGSLNRLLDKLV